MNSDVLVFQKARPQEQGYGEASPSPSSAAPAGARRQAQVYEMPKGTKIFLFKVVICLQYLAHHIC